MAKQRLYQLLKERRQSREVGNSKAWLHREALKVADKQRSGTFRFVCNVISVANAAVYPQNWATLKSPAAGENPVGRVP